MASSEVHLYPQPLHNSAGKCTNALEQSSLGLKPTMTIIVSHCGQWTEVKVSPLFLFLAVVYVTVDHSHSVKTQYYPHIAHLPAQNFV